MSPRKHTNHDNPDFPFIKAEVEEALTVLDEFERGSDALADCHVAEIVGAALKALAEHNGILTHIYGKESPLPLTVAEEN